jgi:hypothetical protein
MFREALLNFGAAYKLKCNITSPASMVRLMAGAAMYRYFCELVFDEAHDPGAIGPFISKCLPRKAADHMYLQIQPRQTTRLRFSWFDFTW